MTILLGGTQDIKHGCGYIRLTLLGSADCRQLTLPNKRQKPHRVAWLLDRLALGHSFGRSAFAIESIFDKVSRILKQDSQDSQDSQDFGDLVRDGLHLFF